MHWISYPIEFRDYNLGSYKRIAEVFRYRIQKVNRINRFSESVNQQSK